MKFLIENNIFFQKYLPWILAFLIAIFVGKVVAKGVAEYDIFLAILLFLPIIFIKPFWGLLICIPLTLWYGFIRLFFTPPRNYLILFLGTIFILTFFLRGGRIKINHYSKKILFFAIFIIFLSLVINLVNEISLEISLINTGRLILFLMLGICTMFFLKNEKRLSIFLYFLFGCLLISAFVGIMQFFGFEFFWRLREIVGLDPKIAPDILARARITGLSFYSIPFGYQLTAILPLIFAFLIQKKSKILSKTYLIATFIICLLALFMTQSRSAIVGGVVGLLLVIFLTHKKKIRNTFFVIATLCLIVLIINQITSGYFLKRFEIGYITTYITDLPARFTAQIAAFETALKYPLGIGRGEAEEYLIGWEKYQDIFPISPHNQFTNILLYYGWLGLLSLILFYYFIFKGLSSLYFKKDFPLRGVAIGLIGSFSAYIINSLFHNDGPFLFDVFNWFFIGVTLFLLNQYGKFSKPVPKYEITQN